MTIRLTLCLLLLPLLAHTQSYTTWWTGDTTDLTDLAPTSGTVLAGGAGDNDDAMTWMLERADGGDVVVLRASGEDGYNPYFFSELGVNVHSVQTIRFNNAAAAQDPYVVTQIRNAECLFIAGGDQYDYYQYWKDTPIEDAINYLLSEKGVPVGGTSAGMAILSNCYYAPSGSSLTSQEALGNPFHPDYTILGKDDFLQVPYTDNLLPDTHYDARDRAGRHVALMARLAHDYQTRSYGIASNEYTAVCIDEQGIARAFGEFDEFPEDIVYFLQANCQDEFLPEVITDGQPLTWNRGNSAVKVYAVPARIDGSGQLDLNDWTTGQGGFWQNWFVDNGELNQVDSEDGDCAAVAVNTYSPTPTQPMWTYPNPASDYLFLDSPPGDWPASVRLTDALGQTHQLPLHNGRVAVANLPAGVYQVMMTVNGVAHTTRVMIH